MSYLLKMTPTEFCSATNACSDGRQFALTQPTMVDVWDNCPRVDWLLWITDKLNRRLDDRTLRLFAVWCARNTPLPDGRKTGDLLTDHRSLTALEVADRFANEMATQEELDAALDAARAAARDATGAAALDAAWAAAWVAQAAALDAARAAARYAAWAATRDAAWAAALDAARDAQSAYFRTLIPNPFQKKAQS